jgi:hypothetical protein
MKAAARIAINGEREICSKKMMLAGERVGGI